MLAGLPLTREQLIEIAILIGTDFNPGVDGVGAKTGLKIVKKGEFAQKLKEKLPDFDPAPVMDTFLHPNVTDDYSVTSRAPGRGRAAEDALRRVRLLARAGGQGTRRVLGEGRAEDAGELVLIGGLDCGQMQKD